MTTEDVITVHSLPVPPEGEEGDVDKYTAAQLFADRARRLRKSFVLAAEAGPVARICRLVDGLPLGIEIAAAWVRDFSCAAIAAAIADNLDVLATTQRDLPPAHRSLRAVFTYSWELLDRAEQELLTRLSVFRGGWTAAAAAAVTGSETALLERLTHKSLLHGGQAGRYEMHEVVRYFAAEKLVAEQANAEAVRAEHAAWFTEFLQQRETALVNADQQLARAEVGADMDNVRQAWAWAAQAGRSDLLEKGARGLYRYYLSNGRFYEGAQLFHEAAQTIQQASEPDERLTIWTLHLHRAMLLQKMTRFSDSLELVEKVLAELTDLSDPPPTVQALTVNSHLITGVDNFGLARSEQAETQLQKALADAQTHRLPQEQAEAHMWLGRVYRNQSAIAPAFSHLTAAVEQFQKLDHLLYEIEATANLGLTAFHAGRYQEAIERYEEALALARRVDNHFHQSRLLTSVGAVYDMQGEYSRGRSVYLQALRIAQGLHEPFGEFVARHNLAVLLSRLGAYEEAERHYEQVLRYRRETGERFGLCMVLLNYGLLFKHLEDYERALALHQEALNLAQDAGFTSQEGLAWARLGQDWEQLCRWEEARAAYRRALAIHRQLEQEHWAVEVQAGLARVALAEGQSGAALEIVNDILEALDEDDQALLGAREYFLVHWSCYQILEANHDERAPVFLAAAHRQLQERAGRIDEPALRRSYLQNVPFHRAIVDAAATAPATATLK